VNTASARLNQAPTGKLIYGWLLLCLFLEYARPASFFEIFNVPYFYSVFPLALFVTSLFAKGLRSPQEAFSDRQAKWLLWLLGLIFLSMLVFRAYAIEVFTTVLGNVMLFVVIARVCTTWERVRGVMKMLIFCHIFLLCMNLNVLMDPSKRQYIVGATFLGDGNDFGLSICLLLPCGLWLARTSPSKLGKLLIYLSMLVLMYAIVASQSRGAVLGVGAVAIFLWWFSKHKAVLAVIGVIAAMGVFALAPAQFTGRMSTLKAPGSDGSAQGRIDAWAGGIGMGANSPLVGVGAGHFGPRWGKTAHSTYVLAFGELGLPGFIVVCGVVFGNIRLTMNLRRRILDANAPPPESKRKARAGPEPVLKAEGEGLPPSRLEWIDGTLLLCTTAMIGFAVAGAFLSATYYPHIYVLTGLMISMRALASKETGIPVHVLPVRRGFKREAAQPGGERRS
jgi:O-antigen ligase